jgi:hypothetical protein
MDEAVVGLFSAALLVWQGIGSETAAGMIWNSHNEYPNLVARAVASNRT